MPTDKLSRPAIEWCQSIGSNAKTLCDILDNQDENVLKAIQAGIDAANKRAPSRAQVIQKWSILPRDFSIPGGELGMQKISIELDNLWIHPTQNITHLHYRLFHC